MIKKEWFNVEEYYPSEKYYDPIEKFFKDLTNHQRGEDFLKVKRRDNPVPSFEDIGLMTYSKEKQYPIISNDNDFTFFAEELFEKELTGKIINFNDLDTYNN